MQNTKPMSGLEIIKSTALLKEDDFDFLSSAAEELRDTMAKRQIFRTETEMEISVLDDVHFPNAASKYWQAVREQAVMFENLVSLSFEYRRNELAIKRHAKKIAESTNEFDREGAQIDLDECFFNRAQMESVAKDRMREIRLWSRIKSDLDDGSFNTSDVNAHQLVSYAQRFIIQAHHAPENMPVAEANNLMGQLSSAIKELDRRGILNEVVNSLPRHVVDNVLMSTGLIKMEEKKAA